MNLSLGFHENDRFAIDNTISSVVDIEDRKRDRD
jgi:hypothetical protein